MAKHYRGRYYTMKTISSRVICVFIALIVGIVIYQGYQYSIEGYSGRKRYGGGGGRPGRRGYGRRGSGRRHSGGIRRGYGRRHYYPRRHY